MDEKKLEEQTQKRELDQQADGFQAIAEGPQKETTQETQAMGQREAKLAATTLSISERLARPFEPLADNTIQAIINTPSANEVDKDAAIKEAEFRKNNGGFNPEANRVDIQKDLENHYYSIHGGRFLVPTDDYVEYRDAIKSGDKNATPPHTHIRETIDERNERMERLANPKTPEDIIANYFDDISHTRTFIKNNGAYRYLDKGETITRAKERALEMYRKSADDFSKVHYAISAYRELFAEALAEREPNLSLDPEALASRARAIIAEHAAERSTRYADGHAFLEMSTELFRNQEVSSLERISDEEKRAALIQAIGDSLGSGTFLGGLCIDDPEAARKYVNELGITDNEIGAIIARFSDEVRYHIEEMSDGEEEDDSATINPATIRAYDEIFGMSERLATSLATGDDIGYCQTKIVGGRLEMESPRGKYDRHYSYIPGEIESRTKEIITQKAKQEAEILQSEESFSDQIESAKDITQQLALKEIGDRIERYGSLPSPTFDIETFLAMRSLDARGGMDLSQYPDYYGRIIRNEMAPIIFDFDPTEMIKKEILSRIAEGARTTYNWNGFGSERVTKFTSSFLNADNFPQIMEQLELSFSDDDSYKMAFRGFMNTLSGVNGERSDAAAGYYRSIFADDPDRFIAAVNAFRNNNCPVGLKRKITRFLNNNEEFQLYVQQKIIRDKLEEERTKTQRIILQETSYDEIKKLIDERKKQLRERIRKRSTDANTTFTPDGAPQENHDKKQRNSDYQASPIDFGTEKIAKLTTWEGYLKYNIDEGVRHFVRKFDDGEQSSSIIGDPNTYHVITFQYAGKMCAIAESFSSDSAAMYVARADDDMLPEALIERMFAGSKADARDDQEMGIEALYHYGDDLDSLYQKAFAYLKTGQRPSNTAEAQENGHHLLGDESELGQIREGELPPQYPFI